MQLESSLSHQNDQYLRRFVDFESRLEQINLKIIQNSFIMKGFNVNSSKSFMRGESFKIPGNGPVKNVKRVRFADSIGRELVTVKFIIPEPAKKYNNKLIDLSDEDDEDDDEYDSDEYRNDCRSNLVKQNSSKVKEDDPNSFVIDSLSFTWKCGFEQPGLNPNFFSLLNKQKILLESIYTNQNRIDGLVRVLNIKFHKHVFLRYTLNDWKTHEDLNCVYLSNESISDRFKFSLSLSKQHLAILDEKNENSKNGQPPSFKLQFALCYETLKTEDSDSLVESTYWDNNNGRNYHFDVFFKIVSVNVVNPRLL